MRDPRPTTEDQSRRLRLVRLPASVGRLEELVSPAFAARLAAELPPGATAWGLIVRSPLWPPVRLGDVLPEVAADLEQGRGDAETRGRGEGRWTTLLAGVAMGIAVGLAIGSRL